MEAGTVDVVLGVEEVKVVNGTDWMVLEVRLDKDEGCTTKELLIDGMWYATESRVAGVVLYAAEEVYATYDGAEEIVLFEDVKT